MGRSGNSSRGDGCLGLVVLALIIAFLAYQCDAEEPESQPSPRPATSVEKTVSPPALPEAGQGDEVGSGGGSRSAGTDIDGQAGIQFGSACAPVGAPGVTEDGRPAKCFMGKDGRARWGYDSKRG